MNFYESSNFGLRVTIYDLKSALFNNIEIRLVPMVHIGEKTYYEEIETKLSESDIILYEGLKMQNNRLRIENRKILANRLGLVTQSKMNLKQFKEKLIHADLDPDTAKLKWTKLPIIDRLKSNFFFPVYMYFQDRTLTRSKFVKYFMKSNEDIDKSEGPMFDKKGRLQNYFHYERDKILFSKIDQTIEKNKVGTKHISIVYGAAHMKSIFRYLNNKYEYQVIKGAFVDVFKT